ncbi:MAG: DUF1858 domain-containing protein [Nanoarchaeota archaeon]|nr:DUF1858 domain-containing protein [Nanoarchaeota archaeon]
MKNAKITGKTKLIDALRGNPNAAEILFNAGMSCIGCPMAMQETIEDGCLAHGMSRKQIEELLKRLNKK